MAIQANIADLIFFVNIVTGEPPNIFFVLINSTME